MKKKLFATNAIFRCIVTLKNGFHKTLRLTIDKVAMFNAAFKQVKEVGLLNARYTEFMKKIELNGYEIKSCKFFNERTGELFLSL